MKHYKYKGLTREGDQKRGSIDASSEQHAQALLKEQHIYPLSVEEVKKSQWHVFYASLNLSFVNHKISGNNLVLFTRQLATLVGSGITLEKAFNLMEQQADNKHVQRFIGIVRQHLSEGYSFANALRRSKYKLAESFIGDYRVW